MAFILIDGYNLIGISHKDLAAARDDLIKKLQTYAALKNHNITVVFDGWKSGQKDQTRKRAGHVTTIYSRLGENADTVIKNMLSSAARPWIVVSSDREISDFAFRKDFAAIHSEEFEFKLYSALRNPENSSKDNEEISLEDEMKKFYEDEHDEPTADPGGNPRQLSRRQKKKLQALKKL